MTTCVHWGYWHQRADNRLDDPPTRMIQEPLVVKDRDGRPTRGLPGSPCVCSGDALLGDLIGVNRSMAEDLPYVLSIYSLCIVPF